MEFLKEGQMLRKLVNKGQKQEEEEEQAGMKLTSHPPVDWISQLPENIIHEILSLLPTKGVAQTSIFSKTWLRAWSSFTCFDLDESYFQEKKTFIDFVDKTLQRCEEQNLVMEKFRLRISICDNSSPLPPRVQTWVKFVTKRRARELDLHIDCSHQKLFIFPVCMFSVKTLKVLKLYGGLLLGYSIGMMNLPNLKKLCLTEVYIDGKALDNLLSRSPLIEDLNLKSCTLKNLNLAKAPHQLTHVGLIRCQGLHMIEIDEPNHQLLNLYNHHQYNLLQLEYRVFMVKSKQTIRELTLIKAVLDGQELQDLIRGLPGLESLFLHFNQIQGSFVIASKSLKRLILTNSQFTVLTGVYAPNLIELEHSTNPVISLDLIRAPDLRKIQLHIYQTPENCCLWFEKVDRFLQHVNNTRDWILVLQTGLDSYLVHEDPTGLRLPPVELPRDYYDGYLTITTTSFSNLVESLCHIYLNVLSIVSPSITQFSEVVHKTKWWKHFKVLEGFHDSEEDGDRFLFNKALVKAYEQMQYQTATFQRVKDDD